MVACMYDDIFYPASQGWNEVSNGTSRTFKSTRKNDDLGKNLHVRLAIDLFFLSSPFLQLKPCVSLQGNALEAWVLFRVSGASTWVSQPGLIQG